MPAIAPSAARAASAPNPVSAAPSAMLAGGGVSAPGDFNAQLDAELTPHPQPSSAAPAPTPAKPQPPAGTAPEKGEGKPDADADADPSDTDPASADDPAAGISAAVLEGMAALLGSLPPVPPTPPPAPAPALPEDAAPSVPAAPSAPDDGKGKASLPADPASGLPALSTGIPASALGTLIPAAAPTSTPPSVAGTALGASLPGAVASAGTVPSASVPTVATPVAAATSASPSDGTENNAVTSPDGRINLPSSGAALPVPVPAAGDDSGKKGKKESADDPNNPKSSQNDPLASAFPGSATVSGNVGTVFSETGGMPAVMEKNAASQASAQAPPAGPALDAIFAATPAKAANLLTVASLLRGYPTGPNSGNGRDANDPAPGTAASGASVALPATPLSPNASSGNAADKSVTLTSNTQFVDVIRQALDERPMPTPQRIAVELQTPPGATVTVFFSQANGQLRAQLSASDSGSLHWLQQQVGALRDGGGNAGSVVWLPPQLDQQPGGGDSSARQQPQQQPQRQDAPSAEDLALAETLFGGTEAGTEATRN